MKEIIFHIGNYKTGSTSIQNAISANRGRLISEGYYVPKSGFAEGAHHDWARSWMKRPMAPLPDELFPAIKSELAKTSCNRILVSSEVLFSGECAQQIVDALPGYRFRVHCYLRRQDHFYSAFYQQLVKHAYFRETQLPTIELLQTSSSTQYMAALECWAAAVGEENVSVYPFEPSQLGSGLLTHFFGLLGVAAPDSYTTKKGEGSLNVTIHNELMEYLRSSNAIKYEREDHMMLLSLLTRIAELPGADDAFHKENVFSPNERRQILAENAEETVEIRRRFVRTLSVPETLFEEGPVADDPDWRRSYLDAEALARISAATWVLQQKDTFSVLKKMYYSKDGIVSFLLDLNQKLRPTA